MQMGVLSARIHTAAAEAEKKRKNKVSPGLRSFQNCFQGGRMRSCWQVPQVQKQVAEETIVLVQNKSTVSRLRANYTLDSIRSNCTKCFFPPSNAITRVCTSESSTTVHEEAHKERKRKSSAFVQQPQWNTMHCGRVLSSFPELFSRGECRTLN